MAQSVPRQASVQQVRGSNPAEDRITKFFIFSLLHAYRVVQDCLLRVLSGERLGRCNLVSNKISIILNEVNIWKRRSRLNCPWALWFTLCQNLYPAFVCLDNTKNECRRCMNSSFSNHALQRFISFMLVKQSEKRESVVGNRKDRLLLMWYVSVT